MIIFQVIQAVAVISHATDKVQLTAHVSHVQFQSNVFHVVVRSVVTIGVVVTIAHAGVIISVSFTYNQPPVILTSLLKFLDI
jgi:hypothetical protein